MDPKFVTGDRVKIDDDLGEGMEHFISGRLGTVIESEDEEGVNTYVLNVDGHGEACWYYEHQLTIAKETL